MPTDLHISYEGKPVVMRGRYRWKDGYEYDDSVDIGIGKHTMKDGVEISFELWGESELTLLDICVNVADVPHITKDTFEAYLQSNEVVVDRTFYNTVDVMEHNGRYIIQVLVDDGD